MKKAAPVTQAEFARIIKVSQEAVRKAINSGRLSRCLVRSKDSTKMLLDPEIASREWVKNTKESLSRRKMAVKPLKQVTDEETGGVTYAEDESDEDEGEYAEEMPLDLNKSRALKEVYEAKIVQMKYEQLSGKLVDADEVKSSWAKMITEAKTRLLAVPSKAKQLIPSLTLKEINLLEKIIREALEDVANVEN